MTFTMRSQKIPSGHYNHSATASNLFFNQTNNTNDNLNPNPLQDHQVQKSIQRYFMLDHINQNKMNNHHQSSNHINSLNQTSTSDFKEKENERENEGQGKSTFLNERPNLRKPLTNINHSKFTNQTNSNPYQSHYQLDEGQTEEQGQMTMTGSGPVPGPVNSNEGLWSSGELGTWLCVCGFENDLDIRACHHCMRPKPKNKILQNSNNNDYKHINNSSINSNNNHSNPITMPFSNNFNAQNNNTSNNNSYNISSPYNSYSDGKPNEPNPNFTKASTIQSQVSSPPPSINYGSGLRLGRLGQGPRQLEDPGQLQGQGQRGIGVDSEFEYPLEIGSPSSVPVSGPAGSGAGSSYSFGSSGSGSGSGSSSSFSGLGFTVGGFLDESSLIKKNSNNNFQNKENLFLIKPNNQPLILPNNQRMYTSIKNGNFTDQDNESIAIAPPNSPMNAPQPKNSWKFQNVPEQSQPLTSNQNPAHYNQLNQSLSNQFAEMNLQDFNQQNFSSSNVIQSNNNPQVPSSPNKNLHNNFNSNQITNYSRSNSTNQNLNNNVNFNFDKNDMQSSNVDDYHPPHVSNDPGTIYTGRVISVLPGKVFLFCPLLGASTLADRSLFNINNSDLNINNSNSDTVNNMEICIGDSVRFRLATDRPDRNRRGQHVYMASAVQKIPSAPSTIYQGRLFNYRKGQYGFIVCDDLQHFTYFPDFLVERISNFNNNNLSNGNNTMLENGSLVFFRIEDRLVVNNRGDCTYRASWIKPVQSNTDNTNSNNTKANEADITTSFYDEHSFPTSSNDSSYFNQKNLFNQIQPHLNKNVETSSTSNNDLHKFISAKAFVPQEAKQLDSNNASGFLPSNTNHIVNGHNESHSNIRANATVFVPGQFFHKTNKNSNEVNLSNYSTLNANSSDNSDYSSSSSSPSLSTANSPPPSSSSLNQMNQFISQNLPNNFNYHNNVHIENENNYLQKSTRFY